MDLARVREGAAGREERGEGGGGGGHAAVGEVVKEGERGREPPRAREAAELGGQRVGVLGVRTELRLRRAGSGGGTDQLRPGWPPRGEWTSGWFGRGDGLGREEMGVASGGEGGGGGGRHGWHRRTPGRGG
jgi:hypothetical protein